MSITSNSEGSFTRRMQRASIIACSYLMSGYLGTPCTRSRKARRQASVLALCTAVTVFRPCLRAYSKARAIRSVARSTTLMETNALRHLVSGPHKPFGVFAKNNKINALVVMERLPWFGSGEPRRRRSARRNRC